MNHPDLEFKHVTPVATKTSHAFVDWADPKSPTGMSGGVRELEFPVYPEEQLKRGEELRLLRRHHGASLRDVERVTGLSPSDVSLLECGGATVNEEVYKTLIQSIGPWQELPKPRGSIFSRTGT